MLVATAPIFAEKYILIDLANQKLYAKDGKETFITSKISSGKANFRTPIGSFNVIAKHRKHKSSSYPKRKNGKHGGTDMPHTLMITKYGIAIHGGYLPGYPVSHGCVRLPKSKAAKLFNWTPYNTKVKIVGGSKRKAKRAKKKINPINIYKDRYTSWTETYYDANNKNSLVGTGREFDYLSD